MVKCPHCGMELADDAKFCAGCGEKLEAAQTASEAPKTEAKAAPQAEFDLSDKIKEFNNTEDTTDQFDAKDIADNKVMAVLAYLSWLVLIPLFAASKSKFARFHVNQGLVLAIVEIAWGVLSSIVVSILGAILGIVGLGGIIAALSLVLNLVNLLFFILSILGIVNAVQGRAKKLPLIGGITLIK